MKINSLDESKIIKKETKIEENKIFNNIPETITNEEITNSSINIEKNLIEQNNIQNDNIKPVFVYEKNKYTNEINTTNSISHVFNFNLNIPKDQLKLMYSNTVKYMNELLLDINILQSLLINNDNMFEFYNEKLNFVSKEYEFIVNKKNILEKLIK